MPGCEYLRLCLFSEHQVGPSDSSWSLQLEAFPIKALVSKDPLPPPPRKGYIQGTSLTPQNPDPPRHTHANTKVIANWSQYRNLTLSFENRSLEMQGRDQKAKDTCSQHSCWQDVRAQYLPSHCCSSFLFSSEMIFLLQLPAPETFHSLPSLRISDQPLKLPPGQSTASRLCPHHPPREPRVLLGHPLTEQTVSPDSPAPA